MTKTKGQQWFNDKYSKETEVNIVGSRRLDLVGSLKVENFTNLTSINLKKLKLTGLEISNCSQLNYINLSGLIKLKSLFVSDCASLTKLDCSSIGLTELEVSNLIELDCSNTSIENLCLNLCPNIIKLNCSNNNKLINLDISNCFKLEFLDCSNSKLTRLDISNCPKSIEVINSPDLVINQEKGIKNLLIIGRTDGGKSTLCNVLCDTKDFEESEYTAKVTKNFQRNDFTWNGTKYRVVEIGIRSIEKKGLYNKIVEGIYSMPEGISQVLFVVDERFTTEAIKKLKLFEKALFESGICDYTTIVRTKFSNFKNPKECEKDRNQLFEENETIAKIVKSCRGIVYVDNPPINILANDDDGDDDDDDKETIRINGIRRKTSRNKLLVHLETVCQGKYYTLDIWNELYSKIANYIELGENSPTIVEEVECKLKLKVPALVNLNFDDQEIFDDVTSTSISDITKINYSNNQLEEGEKEEKIKNLLIVGLNGRGKSTLCNVLTDTDEFEVEKKESLTSVTEKFQKKDFEWNETKYRVVDTIGVGLTTKKGLYKIAEGIYSMPEGISQILFVIDGRFTTEEIKVFELLEKVIFEPGILEYVTIIRTKFGSFRNKDECENDKKKLLNEENESIVKIVKSCKDVVYVDNPPTNILVNDDDDRYIADNNKKVRARSRTILLNYLAKDIWEKYFKLKTWDELHEKIIKYIEENRDNLQEEVECNSDLVKVSEGFCSIF